MEFERGEVVEWIIEGKTQLALCRRSSPPATPKENEAQAGLMSAWQARFDAARPAFALQLCQLAHTPLRPHAGSAENRIVHSNHRITPEGRCPFCTAPVPGRWGEAGSRKMLDNFSSGC